MEFSRDNSIAVHPRLLADVRGARPVAAAALSFGRVALGLAFLALGLRFCFSRLLFASGLPPLPFLDLTLCLPAALLGAGSWLRSRSFANSWPVIVCLLLVWFGLFYADRSESKRGFYHAGLLTITLPVAALIVHQRAWAFCAKTFVVGSVVATFLIAWLQLGTDRGWANLANVRFGLFFPLLPGYTITNPNEVGFHLAEAAVLAFLLYLEGGSAQVAPGCRRADRLGLIWTALLAAGCLLTVCRGAIVAGFVGLVILALWGTRRQDLRRVKDMLVTATLGLTLVLFLAVASGRTPWEGLKARFVEDRSVATLGDRIGIWQNIHRAMCSNSKYLFLGTGTGMAAQVLGRFDTGAMEDSYGRLHRNCHNLYLDWFLTYGLVGLAAGACLVLAMGYRTVKLDHRDACLVRTAMLATVGLLGMTGVMYQQVGWVATGSMVLAMLSDVPLFRGPSPRRPAAARSPWDLPASMPGRTLQRPAVALSNSPRNANVLRSVGNGSCLEKQRNRT